MLADDHAPFWCGMTQANQFYSSEAQAGRPAVLLVTGNLPSAASASLMEAFSEAQERFSRHDTDILLLVGAHSPCVLEFLALRMPGITIVFCPDLSSFPAQDTTPAILVVDRRQTVIAVIDPHQPSESVSEAEKTVAGLLREPARDILLPAPLLPIPGIFTHDFCRFLIEEFERSSHRTGGMASTGPDGKPIHRIDESKKKRNDFVIPAASDLAAAVTSALIARCIPEMKKAFQFEARYADRLLIARYDDTGGYFRRHRDNNAAATAFRQFALSINLNTEEFEGGFLEFPEYNDHRYRPETGAGLIFSASLLHEATPVTRGRRYCLLTFFQGETMPVQDSNAA
ncbi:2OG-Fe(II) oxygenase family protein [Acetobacter conturbans]|uniref:Fe2OG dioxygenase domain-containing protein n=1 Tax=Acetobacter conturbans TaxID=1737472 RepID=A0ABX0JWC1_9PROT|nr:2OG-Fe(II) oxygenase [Acetobacter conturbans]NHN87139.1 hypothetical protein [Acetobacter conturbans]